jgi:hypothetical protein
MERDDLYLHEYNYGEIMVEGVRNTALGGKWLEIKQSLDCEHHGEEISATFNGKK